MTKTSTVIPKGVFQRSGSDVIFSLRQVIGAYGGFPAKVEPGCG